MKYVNTFTTADGSLVLDNGVYKVARAEWEAGATPSPIFYEIGHGTAQFNAKLPVAVVQSGDKFTTQGITVSNDGVITLAEPPSQEYTIVAVVIHFDTDAKPEVAPEPVTEPTPVTSPFGMKVSE
jgi:hypothetical protein